MRGEVKRGEERRGGHLTPSTPREARPSEARRSKARREARRGKAKRGEEATALSLFPTRIPPARRGEARRGEARRGEVKKGDEAIAPLSPFTPGEARQSEARRGEARRGKERRESHLSFPPPYSIPPRRGEAKRGEAKRGEASKERRGDHISLPPPHSNPHCEARQSEARQSEARHIRMADWLMALSDPPSKSKLGLSRTQSGMFYRIYTLSSLYAIIGLLGDPLYHAGGVAHSVERSVRNRQAQGSKPCSSSFYSLFSLYASIGSMLRRCVPSGRSLGGGTGIETLVLHSLLVLHLHPVH